MSDLPGIHWVREPLAPPNVCAVIPGRGASSEPRGFYDTRNDLAGMDPHIYISYAGIEVLAKEIGWVPKDVLQEAHDELDRLREEIRRLEDENQQLGTVFDAIDTLESADFRARRKAGRKPRAKSEEVAA
jgi:hypothetical protein